MLPPIAFTEMRLKAQAVFPKLVPVFGGTKESREQQSMGKPDRVLHARGKPHGLGAAQSRDVL